jgi:hypothetical protein
VGSSPAQRKRVKPTRIAALSMRMSDFMRSGVDDRHEPGAARGSIASPFIERAVRATFFQSVGALRTIVSSAHGKGHAVCEPRWGGGVA